MIDVPALCPDTVDAVVVLECEGELKADTRRRISYTQQVDKLRAFDARLEVVPAMVVRKWSLHACRI